MTHLGRCEDVFRSVASPGSPELAKMVDRVLPGCTKIDAGLPDIEAALPRLAAIAEGAPDGQDEPLARPEGAAAPLIVRELMQHAGAQQVSLG